MTDTLELGAVVCTSRIKNQLLKAYGDRAYEAIDFLLACHDSGCWGDLDAEDIKTNEWGIENGGTIMSVYKLNDGPTVWIITEWDRSVTTVLAPEDY